jgi:Fe-S cluster biosynthesis and repair protein YggX
MVQCIKLKREAEGLDRPPLPGELGKRLFEQVSKDGWQQWREHSKMLVNEYRLDLTRNEHKNVWDTECEKFFFGDGSKLPDQFKAVDGAAGAAPADPAVAEPPKAEPPKG